MKYWGPINSAGGINGNDGYVDGNPATGTQGSIPSFHGFEQMLRGLQRVVSSSGQTPDSALDDVQIAQAIAHYASGARWGLDTGSANAKVISILADPAFKAPVLLFDGLHVKFLNAVENSGAVTANVFGTGVKSVVDIYGGALTSGMMRAGRPCELYYSAALSSWVLLPASTTATYNMIAGLQVGNNESTAIPNNVLTTVGGWGYTGTTKLSAGSSFDGTTLHVGAIDAGLWILGFVVTLDTAAIANAAVMARLVTATETVARSDVYTLIGTAPAVTTAAVFPVGSGDDVHFECIQLSGVTQHVKNGAHGGAALWFGARISDY